MGEVILYQAYGDIRVVNECKFSLLRMIHLYKENVADQPAVILYTDQPREFDNFVEAYNITLVLLNKEQICKWRGDIDFVHRVKIEVIKDCFARFPGKVLYIDSDTYCTRPLSPLFADVIPSNVFLHSNEGSLHSSFQFRKWKRFLERACIPLFRQFSPLHVKMWNAGVIGLHYSQRSMVDEVLELTDEVYRLFPKHIAEQFSFCYILQKHEIHISAASPFFYHYWNLKEFRSLLERFFEKYKDRDITELAALSAKLRPDRMVAEKIRFEKANFVIRLLLKTLGRAWNIGKYEI